MCSIDKGLFWWGNTEDTKARILATQFNGASNTGGTARLAVEEMLRSLPTERVTIFDTDTFLDYRSCRPFATVSDWVLESVKIPELVLNQVKDDLDNLVLVLHDAESDARWGSFSGVVTELVTRAGVEVVVFFGGMPSGAPRMGPMPVHVQVMEEAFILEQPQMTATLCFPTLMTTFLQERLANQGIPGIVFLVVIPFHVADTVYPADASAPLSALSGLVDLPLPAGELEQDAAEEHMAIERVLGSNSEMQYMVAALEEYFGALNGAGEDGVSPGEWAERTPLRSGRKTGEDTGDVIEAYLANLTEQSEKDGAEEMQVGEESDPLQAALRRVELRRLGPNASRNVGRSRHSTQPESDESVASPSAGPSAQGGSASGEQNSGKGSSHWFLRGGSVNSTPSWRSPL